MRHLCSAFILICSPLLIYAQEQAALLPVPDSAAQKESLRLVVEIYKTEYDAAKTSEQQVAFAEMLIKSGLETENDATSKYVLYRLASDVASKAGDVQVAFDAISHLDDTYNIDALQMKVGALGIVVKSRSTSKEQKAEAAKLAIQLIDDAVRTDNYTTANQFGKLALSASRMSGDAELRKSATSQVNRIALVQSEFEKAKEALAVLETNPADAQANLTVGTFHCLMKGDFETGLPMLALGSDPVLKRLAVKELGRVSDRLEQTQLGDGWWSLAEEAEGTAKERFQQRAAHWYQQALPHLSGLAKAKVVKRLGDLREPESVPVRREEWISKDATYRVSSTYNGKTPLPSLLNESQQFHYGDQYAFVTKVEHGAWVTIDLLKPKRITRVFILNRTILRERAIGMSLYISLDGKRQHKVWSATQGLSEWNVQLRNPIQGRYLTLKLPDHVKQHLSLKKVQVFGD